MPDAARALACAALRTLACPLLLNGAGFARTRQNGAQRQRGVLPLCCHILWGPAGIGRGGTGPTRELLCLRRVRPGARAGNGSRACLLGFVCCQA